MKTQWPRSADEPGLYMAQTGNSGPPRFLCGGGPTVWRLVACVLGVCPSVSVSWRSVLSLCHVTPVGAGRGRLLKSLSLRGQGRRIPRRQCLGDTPCRRRCPSLVGDPAAEEWSPWSVCSLTCGQGLQVRTRSCVSSPYGTLCSGPLRETRPCNNSATCPGMPILPAWSACRVRSCLGLGQVHLPKMVGCLLLSFSKVDRPPWPPTIRAQPPPRALGTQMNQTRARSSGLGSGHVTALIPISW